jgi:uncharacterized protein with GYD domain
MATCIALMRWTDQGIGNYRRAGDRHDQAKTLAGRFGVEVKDTFWTPGGPYDVVSVWEGPEGKGFSAFVLALEALGNVRVTLTDAYRPDAMREVIATGG